MFVKGLSVIGVVVSFDVGEWHSDDFECCCHGAQVVLSVGVVEEAHLVGHVVDCLGGSTLVRVGVGARTERQPCVVACHYLISYQGGVKLRVIVIQVSFVLVSVHLGD